MEMTANTLGRSSQDTVAGHWRASQPGSSIMDAPYLQCYNPRCSAPPNIPGRDSRRAYAMCFIEKSSHLIPSCSFHPSASSSLTTLLQPLISARQ